MSKILRKVAKIFGSNASANQIAKFGSLAAGSPQRYSGATADPDNIQALGEWLDGWNSAQVGAGAPAIEDMNGFCFTMAYQIAYAMQEGIPEWDPSTTYYIGSIVQDGSAKTYYSLVDNNLNHLLTDVTKWGLLPDLIASQMTTVGTDAIASTMDAGGANTIATTRTIATSAPAATLGNMLLNLSTGVFATSSTTFVDVTNQSGSLVVHGNPVEISLEPDASGSAARIGLTSFSGGGSDRTFTLQVLRGVTVIFQTQVVAQFNAGGAELFIPPAIRFTDTPAAGTYTYKLQAKVDIVNTTGGIENCRMKVFEYD